MKSVHSKFLLQFKSLDVNLLLHKSHVTRRDPTYVIPASSLSRQSLPRESSIAVWSTLISGSKLCQVVDCEKREKGEEGNLQQWSEVEQELDSMKPKQSWKTAIDGEEDGVVAGEKGLREEGELTLETVVKVVVLVGMARGKGQRKHDCKCSSGGGSSHARKRFIPSIHPSNSR